MVIEEYGAMPGLAGLYRRAVVGAVTGRPAQGPAPGAELVVRNARVDRDQLARYVRVCGFRLSSALPPTYPHVVAFPLMLELMTRPDFPFVLTGLVHQRNVIEQERALSAEEPMQITVRAESLRDHPRGRTIDVVTVIVGRGRAVWRERSTYLRRSDSHAGSRAATEVTTSPPQPSALWRVGTDVGPGYAAVSGDRNPIHTSRLLARLLGFPRPIAHGMWTAARCLAALEGRVPTRSTVDISFRSPVLLPATIAFSSTPRDDGIDFSLRDARSARTHLTGAVRQPR